MKHSRLRPYDVEESTYDEEFYQHYYTCRYCDVDFMVSHGVPHYCPVCGHKIERIKKGLLYLSIFEEDNDDN